MSIPQIIKEFNDLAEEEGYYLNEGELFITMFLFAPDPGGMYPTVSLRMGAIQQLHLYEIWNDPIDKVVQGLSHPNQIIRVLTKYRVIKEEL
jgi:hypothetical protein